MSAEFYNLLSQLYIKIIEFDNERHNEFPLGAPYNFFGQIIEGEARFQSSYCDFTIKEGEIVYIPKGCVYSSHWTPVKKVRFYSLGFRFLEPEKNETFLLQKVEGCEGLNREIEKMYENLQSPNDAAGIFYQLYAKACTVLKQDARTKKYLSVYPAVQYIRAHCCEDFGVAHLAKLCKMSEPYFYPTFKAEMGCSPIKYKNKLKCTMAVEMLLTGEDTLEVICARLNFSSPAFLRRLLKQETGMTPKQIRREKYSI